MTRIAHFDCVSGIAGDMTLGALIDAGVPVGDVQTAVQSLGLAEVTITADDVKKHGFRATQIRIDHPPQHAHRHLRDITRMIDGADGLSDAAKRIAGDIFTVIGRAEATVHGTTIEKVHFHEVGAIDSIADIVGVAYCLDALGIDRVTASPVPTGTGTIKIDHGVVPVPAPATALILSGIPLAPCDLPHELTTPTGAAILKSRGDYFGAMPAMTIDRVGFGAGTLDLPDRGNVLRVTIGVAANLATDGDPATADTVTVIETNLDDADPRDLAIVADSILAAGALDVWRTPVVMKKGRIGVTLSVICEPSLAPDLERLILDRTPSIGIRRRTETRRKLPRRSAVRSTPWGDVRVKTVTRPDGHTTTTIEDDDVRRIADEHGVAPEAIRRSSGL